MKELKQTITSIEVAEMMEVNHWEVLRKLDGTEKVKGIIPTLTDNKIVVSDFFVVSTYKDASGKLNKCYNVTKLGCDFLANKFTGEKGILFTAKYVKKFHEMETILLSNSIAEINPDIKQIRDILQSIKYIMSKSIPAKKYNKWTIETNSKIKLLAEYFHVSHLTILSNIYIELEDTYGIDLNEYQLEYCNNMGLENCSQLDVIQSNKDLKQSFSLLIDSFLELYGLAADTNVFKKRKIIFDNINSII